MPEPREWHELADDVPELRPTKRGGRRYLICNADVEDWWWCGGEDQSVREDTDIAYALHRERAVQWLARRGIFLHPWVGGWAAFNQIGELAPWNKVRSCPDFDACLRLAVDAVRGT